MGLQDASTKAEEKTERDAMVTELRTSCGDFPASPPVPGPALGTASKSRCPSRQPQGRKRLLVPFLAFRRAPPVLVSSGNMNAKANSIRKSDGRRPGARPNRSRAPLPELLGTSHLSEAKSAVPGSSTSFTSFISSASSASCASFSPANSLQIYSTHAVERKRTQVIENTQSPYALLDTILRIAMHHKEPVAAVWG